MVEPPLATNGESILNSEKSALKANGVQEGSESVPLFAPKCSSPGPLSQRPEPLNMEFSGQMARDWNPESSLVETAKMKRRVARAVMVVQLPGAAGVRNWIRSFRRSSQRTVQSAGSA